MNITASIISQLKKENTKIAKRALEYINKDRLVIYYDQELGFYLEPTSPFYSIPNYIHDYLLKKLKSYAWTLFY